MVNKSALGMKIMVVDDDEIMLNALYLCLTRAGYQTVTVTDGIKALEIFNAGKNFDLIISDIMMPGLSGFTLLDTIRNMAKDSVPVILISSLDKAKTISSRLDLKADDIIVKPIDFDKLLLKISSLLGLSN